MIGVGLYRGTIHFGYWAGTIKDFLRSCELRNMPHFARGVFLAMLGYWLGGPWSALGLTFAASFAWEVRDFYKADGFDVLDVICEMWGAVSLVLWTMLIGGR